MKKQTLWLIICATLVLVLSIAVVMLISLLPDKEVKYFDGNKYELVRNVNINRTSNGVTLKSVDEVTIDKHKGNIYYASATNTFGTMEITITIEKIDNKTINDVLNVYIIEIKQDFKVEGLAYVKDNWVNVKDPKTAYKTIKEVPTSISAGSTIPRFTTSGIYTAAKLAILKEYNIVDDPYADIFGSGYVIGSAVYTNSYNVSYGFSEVGSSVKTIEVTKKEVRTGGVVSGYIYIAKGAGAHEDISDNGILEVEFAFDASFALKGYKGINTTEHDFFSSATPFITNLYNKTIAEIKLAIHSDYSDLVSGSTRSSALIKSLMLAIVAAKEAE